MFSLPLTGRRPRLQPLPAVGRLEILYEMQMTSDNVRFMIASLGSRSHGILFVLGLLSLQALAADAEFRPIFNGKDLTGWDGDSRFWSVREGVLRGETTLSALPRGNTFLIWRGEKVKDFQLRVKFRIQNGNSGVQFRSKDLGNWVVRGYQAEVENKPGKVGFLYEEKGRKYLANVGEKVEMTASGERNVIGHVADKNELVRNGYYRVKDWNEYLIIARGNHIEQWLNGFQTVELIDNDEKRRTLEGIVALQIHAGPPMIVEYKDILLKPL